MLKRWLRYSFVFVLFITQSARAELEIIITEGIDTAQPIAVVPFEWKGSGSAPSNIADIVAADLARSGQFSPIKESELPQQPKTLDEIDFKAWTSMGASALVMGSMSTDINGNYVIDFKLIDLAKGQLEAGKQTMTPEGTLVRNHDYILLNNEGVIQPERVRNFAHRISDLVYEELTGQPGAFLTRIAYVVIKEKAQYPYQLMVADYDGYNESSVVRGFEPLMSPTWSPDGKKLAYVSFENKRSQVFIQDLQTGRREVVASFPRHNGSPRFSPDGSKLALVLSKSGSLHLYVLDMQSGRLSKLTHGRANNTEPFWTPDGKKLIYTSDQGGQPQIYELDLASKSSHRITWQGKQNLGGQITPDGKEMVMVNQSVSGYNIAKQDLQTGVVQVLTKTLLDESPSIAPNGSMIIYSSIYGKHNVLSLVSIDGRFKARLPLSNGRVRSPAWSPFLN